MLKQLRDRQIDRTLARMEAKQSTLSTNQSYIPAGHLATFPEVMAAQSTRHGGVSQVPYNSLNVGHYTPDSIEQVRANREHFFTAMDWPSAAFVESHQVHQDQLITVEEPGSWEGFDGLLTQKKGLALTITVADCCPVLLYDPVTQSIGAAHAGWKGTVAGIAAKLIRRMQADFGVQPADLYAWTGVCISSDHYEVDADVADQFPEAHKQWVEERGKFLLDVPGANAAQIQAAGVPSQRLEQASFCTYREHKHFFSHRYDRGQTGRGWAVIGLRP